jgi:hypothetical protein
MGHSDKWGTRAARAGMLAISLSVAGVSLTATGCRITDDDVSAWARKASGPRKLVAVLQHDKYDLSLRINAAMTLVSMPSRGGRAVGLLGGEDYIGLLGGLTELSEEERTPIVNGMIPRLVEGISRVPEGDEADASIPYKDAAYAMLSESDGALVSDPKSQEALKEALIKWCQSNFESRMDDTTQLYGMEQVLRYVRAPGVRGLTPLFEADFKKMRQLAQLVDEIGDDATKLDASNRLVKVAEHVDSEAWVKQKAPAVEAANKASGFDVKPNQFEKQLEAYQEEELLRIFGAMKSVGEKPVVEYLLGYAANAENPEKRRAAALAGLEGNLDRKNQAHAKAMLDYMSDDKTPDLMRDVASRRVGELSREQVAERLYSLFSTDRWQLRATVASLLLKMSDAKHIDEFMTELGKTKNMAISEPLLYGPLLKDVKGQDPVAIAEKYAAKNYPAPVRLTALGYWYDQGSKSDLAKVQLFKDDKESVPACHKDAEQCAWSCTIQGEKGLEAKEVKTIGEFVEYCLVPAMSQREAIEKVAEPGKEAGKKDEK